MPKYMVQGSYSLSGVQGVLKEGGSGRRAATEQAVTSIGGKVEAYYFAFGSDDFVLIFDAPSNEAVAALSLAGAASGAVSARVTVLLTPEELDAAVRLSPIFRPPGA